MTQFHPTLYSSPPRWTEWMLLCSKAAGVGSVYIALFTWLRTTALSQFISYVAMILYKCLRPAVISTGRLVQCEWGEGVDCWQGCVQHTVLLYTCPEAGTRWQRSQKHWWIPYLAFIINAFLQHNEVHTFTLVIVSPVTPEMNKGLTEEQKNKDVFQNSNIFCRKQKHSESIWIPCGK